MTNIRIIWILFILTMILMIILRFQNMELVTPSAEKGIISLEFSTSAAQVNAIREEWTGGVRSSFHLNTILDYFYLFFYGLFLFFTCRYFALLKPGVQKVGMFAALGGLSAAGFDAIENLLMMISIHFGGNNVVAIFTAIFASFKFLLAALSLLYIIVSLFMGMFRKAT